MASVDPSRCPSCGAERPANSPEGLCPRCVLRHAMEPDSPSDATPAPDSYGPRPVLETLGLTAGSMPRVRLFEPDRAAGAGEPDPAVAIGSTEMPSTPGDAGHLELLGEIARGGMGAVLKGRDPDIGRDLAVKVLLEAHKDKPDLTRRFLEEAQIAGQLQHPGVVPIYELGAFADRRPYFTMKLVKGRTLAALLSERMTEDGGRMNDEGGRMKERDRTTNKQTSGSDSSTTPHPSSLASDGSSFSLHPSSFILIFERICRTMAYAHARGVIHRDLKPSNIMVGGFGEVQVMDWGLAKVLPSGGVADESRAIDRRQQVSLIRTLRTGSDAEVSQAGSVMGTPAYMPPEQAGGDVEALDERADVFGLGAILCEILTGSPPYAGRDGDEVFRKAVRGDLADAMARLDSCGADPDLVDLAKSCLAPELLDRPRDARIVAERLADHLAGVQERLRTAELGRARESARATEAIRKARAERQARRLAAGLAAAVIIAIATGAGGMTWFVSARNARRAAAAREADELFARLSQLRAKARVAPAGAVIPWDEALAEARRAADRARELNDPRLAGRIGEIAAELEQGRRAAGIQAERLEIDRKLLSELESIRGNLAEHLVPERTDAEYTAAFRNAGLDLDATDPQQAGDWIAARSAPLELASFLDDWTWIRRMAQTGEPAWRRLVAAARAADKDRWRDAVRAGVGDQSPGAREALRKIAEDEKALESQPAESLRLLARRLKGAGDREAAARVLRRAWRLRPDDFWVNFELARAPGAEFGSPDRELFPHPEEGVRYLTAALAVRPTSAMAHHYLAFALSAQGRSDEATAEWRIAIRLKPDFARAHNGLGILLNHQAKLDEAIAEFREAIRLKPDYAFAHNNLGSPLAGQGKLDEAVSSFRAALRLKPDSADAHDNLGIALARQGKLDEAIAAFRAAIRLKPDHVGAHSDLGIALARQGKLDEAVAAFREAIRLKPDFAEAHCSLGFTLSVQGKVKEALAELRVARDHAGPDPEKRFSGIGRRIAALERQNRLLDRLPRLLKGQDQPANPAQGIEFATLCYQQGLPAASARLYAAALKADPDLADDRRARHAYNAACAAALAGCGQGHDDPPPGEAARANLREQALDWLKAELAVWHRIADGNDHKVRAGVAQTLQHWKTDTNLAGVRDPGALAKLPEAERAAWQALWADVDRLLNGRAQFREGEPPREPNSTPAHAEPRPPGIAKPDSERAAVGDKP